MTGEQIKEMRQRLRLTQVEFAALVGTTQSTVARWETGACKPSRFAVKVIEQVTKRRLTSK